jgi:hypothetical protein
MPDDETTVANLNRLLDIERDATLVRDTRIADLYQEVERLERQLDTSVLGWSRHRPWKEDGLPVPRLELRWKLTAPGEAVALFVLVYRHFLDHVEAVPLGQTRCSGGGYRVGENRPADMPPLFHAGTYAGMPGLDLPFRDGSHLKHNAKHLGLPAYISTDDGDVTQLDPETWAQTWIRRAAQEVAGG